MTQRLYLHIGAPKSGTTYLQSVLRHNRGVLGEAGVLVVGSRHVEVVYAGLVIREDPRVKGLSDHEAASWDRLVEEVLAWDGDTAVLSYELLSAATQEQAAAAIARFEGVEVHVVFGARDFGRALPSAWQERLKFGLAQPLETWVPQGNGPRTEWGWRTMDPVEVLSRWAPDLPPDRIHVVTVPRAGTHPAELWRRFARACRIDVPEVDLGVATHNESLSPAGAELLRRVNGFIGDPITGNREHARWIRDTLAHQVLVPHGGKERVGVTDAQFEDARTRSEAAIEALRTTGYDVQGDLEEIRATRPTGRTPGQVGDAELVELAAHGMAELLVLLRKATLDAELPPPGATEEPGRSLKTRARSALRRAAEQTGAPYLRRRTERVADRLEALETVVTRSRVMQRRVGDLEDIVLELLVPTAEQDDEQVIEAVRRYRKESL